MCIRDSINVVKCLLHSHGNIDKIFDKNANNIFYILCLFLVRFSAFARRLGQTKFTDLSFSITNLHFSITNLNFFLLPPNT